MLVLLVPTGLNIQVNEKVGYLGMQQNNFVLRLKQSFWVKP
jgi:hypothetical protein